MKRGPGEDEMDPLEGGRGQARATVKMDVAELEGAAAWVARSHLEKGGGRFGGNGRRGALIGVQASLRVRHARR